MAGRRRDASRSTRGVARRQAAKPAHDQALTTRSWTERPRHLTEDLSQNVTVECGWGRLIFGQTFDSHDAIHDAIAEEEVGRRDICMYVRDPHVLVSMAPAELFIDPSHTYRLWLHRYRAAQRAARGITVRGIREEADADAINRLYAASGMVTAPTDVIWSNQRTKTFVYLVAEDAESGDIVGTVSGVDHRRAFEDPEQGSSLWCLAVDPQAVRPGLGEALVRGLAERFKARGRAYMDLSVVHDNRPAIALYEKLGFERVPVFAIKRKNPINERFFAATAADDHSALNPYARIIAEEALRRGIAVKVVDAEAGLMELSHGGRTVSTRESLSELTSAVAMTRCDDKRLTRRLLERAGVSVPRGRVATFDERDRDFLSEVGEVVVKPARGEQGNGITVGVADGDALEDALTTARRYCPDVLVEEMVAGDDLRVLVIGGEVVAAAVRRPASIVGTGTHTIEELVHAQSRRRSAATGGESRIPLDRLTVATIHEEGFALDDVLPEGQRLDVRRTANLHTGGTIHDVTDRLSATLRDAAVLAARTLDIPVVGIDMLVPDVEGEAHVVIEANERPGLANHEPRPTAQRFVDLLFPATRALPSGWQPGQTRAGEDHQLPEGEGHVVPERASDEPDEA